MDETRSGTIQLGTKCRLTMSLAPLDADTTLGSVDLTVNGQTIGTGFETSPQEADLFVRQLEWMHQHLSGDASIRGYMNRTMIKFAMGDPRFGRVLVSGEFTVAFGGGDPPYDDRVTVRFDKLTTDQSYLPEFIRGLREPG